MGILNYDKGGWNKFLLSKIWTTVQAIERQIEVKAQDLLCGTCYSTC